MISANDAKDTIIDSTILLDPEKVSLVDSTNRFSSEDIKTRINLPLWDNSSMDGRLARSNIKMCFLSEDMETTGVKGASTKSLIAFGGIL